MGQSVSFTDAQLSRTFLPSATFDEKTANNWAFSIPNRGSEAFGKANSLSERFETGSQQSPQPVPTLKAVYAANLACHRSNQVYEKHLKRGKSIDDATAASQKFLASHLRIDKSVTAEERDALVLRQVQLACDETDSTAMAVMQRWVDEGMTIRKVDGMRSLILPCPAPSAERWFGAKHWAKNVVSDPGFLGHYRVKRAREEQVKIIVEAMSWVADSATGYWCAITCNALARKVISLYRQRSKAPRGTCGWKLDTVASNVRAVWAALKASGWAQLRAEGRNLRTEERLVALSLFGIEQTGAGNVFDLTVPQCVRESTIQRHRDSAPTRPHWAQKSNPFVAQCQQDKTGSSLEKASSDSGLLHTYLPVGQPSSKTKDHYGSQTHAQARTGEKHSSTKRAKPSLTAQRLAAGLVRHMPWLSKDNRGKPVHMWSLSFAVERSGIMETGWSVAEIVDAWDKSLAQRWWEIQPGEIVNPAGWLRVCLRALNPSTPIRG